MREDRIMTVPAMLAPWTTSDTVNGFARALPNEVLLRFADEERRTRPRGVIADIGCGAGRNAVPLARMGWAVLGTDLSWPMLAAGLARARHEAPSGRVLFAHAPMESIPMADASADLVVAHGVWNLAASSAEFQRAVAEAARVAKPGGGLFVFTFSRRTLPPDAAPVARERFVFTQFSGRPQVFLTDAQLIRELGLAGFDPDPAVPLTEYNRPSSGSLRTGSPVIYEAAFRRRG
jgi:SAM-dependent methyltransferase